MFLAGFLWLSLHVEKVLMYLSLQCKDNGMLWLRSFGGFSAWETCPAFMLQITGPKTYLLCMSCCTRQSLQHLGVLSQLRLNYCGLLDLKQSTVAAPSLPWLSQRRRQHEQDFLGCILQSPPALVRGEKAATPDVP